MSYGRRKIKTDATKITPENVVDEVRKATLEHDRDRSEINTLYDYYRGKTKILRKQKEVRESINWKITENRAYEVVRFHKGYTFGEPIQYIRREKVDENQKDDAIASGINALNAYMAAANKAACDERLASWMYIGGTGYRMVLPNPNWSADSEESPFELFALDPRRTRVVYSNDVRERPLFAYCCVEREHGERVYSGYTDEFYFEYSEHGGDVTITPHALGMIPIIEYPANDSRLGVFETVLSLLDALDTLQSNRMDDVVQYVNSFLAILGGELDEQTYKKLNEWKTLCLPEGTDAKYLSPAMNQYDVQTFKNDICQAILTICGVPNRNGGSSTSDTGSAVMLRDGWEAAEAHAKSTETVFKSSEKECLKLVLRILRDTVGTNVKLTDIVPHFTRRNYENIASKSQVLIAMLNNPSIHPELAFSHCGMFADPESAYLQSKAWKEENEKKAEEKAREIQGNDPKGSPEGDPEAGGEAEEEGGEA